MAKLSDFIGGLLSSVSEARLNSDLQSVQTAELYAQDELLKVLSVPRLRIDKVEMNIPVAIRSSYGSHDHTHKSIDLNQLSYKTYQIVLQSLRLKSLSRQESMELKRCITEHARIAESKMNTHDHTDVLVEFAKSIASRTIETLKMDELKLKDLLARENEDNLRDRIERNLEEGLKPDINVNSDRNALENLEVEVESNKLQEISPENKMMIKMTITEHGMEWSKVEHEVGEF